MKNIKIPDSLVYTKKPDKKIHEARERLDIFLTNNVPDLTRNKIQKKIKNKEILVNKKEISAHYKLKEGDNITFKNKISINAIENKNEVKKNNELFKKIKVIKKTNEFLVIYKPAGLIVHGADHIKTKTLADWLIGKYPEIKKIGDDPIRPGMVHRLDKEVSGLMVVALTSESFDNLKSQFINRKIDKEYTALVYGKINKDYDIINFSIKRSSDGYKMATIPYNFGKNLVIAKSLKQYEEKRNNSSASLSTSDKPKNKRKKNQKDKNKARRAMTEFEIIKKFINYTLLKVRIKTGRTHQIRVHMCAYSHSIVGDNLYSTKKTREKNIKVGLERIFLQATKLVFFNLNKEKQSFEIKLDKELKDMLKKIK